MRFLRSVHLAVALAALVALIAVTGGHPTHASGTLFNIGVFVQSFPGGGSVFTPISAENDGTFIWTASGGGPSGPRLTRHLLDGTVDQSFSPGIDFRSLYADNSGQLFAKAFGAGAVFSLTTGGVPTFLYTLSGAGSQSSASLNGDDTEVYTRNASTIRRYNAANGAFISSFTLIGITGAENAFPDFVQMETNSAGRILTYSNGVVSEWDLGGNRIGQSTIPIATPTNFNTKWSFGVGNDDLVYLFNNSTRRWESYDIGITSVKEVDIDIKPGSDPNSIKCNKDKGVIAVAILTTDDFVATTVDHTTVTFEGASETHVDKTTGEPRRHEEDVDDDGDTDLVFHFRLGDTNLTCDSTEGTLSGETFDGQALEGTDDVRMVGR